LPVGFGPGWPLLEGRGRGKVANFVANGGMLARTSYREEERMSLECMVNEPKLSDFEGPFNPSLFG